MKEYLVTMGFNCEVIGVSNVEYIKKTGQYENILSSVHYWKEGDNKDKLIKDFEEIAKSYNKNPSLVDTTKYEENQMAEMMKEKEKENKKTFDSFKEWIKCEIDFELYKNGFIDESDRTERDSIKLAKKIIEGTEYTEDDEDILIEYIENILEKNYNCVSDCDEYGDYTCYYYNDKYSFETIEDLENKFNIGA